MSDQVWKQSFRVNTLLAGTRKRLTLPGVLSILQDAAWDHANAMHFGYEDLRARGTLWAMTKQRVDMSAWPAWGDSVEVHTWSRPFEGFIARRDFELYQGGSLIGTSATEWINLDVNSRRPKRLTLEGLGHFWRDDHRVAYDPVKIAAGDSWQDLTAFRALNSDLDVNGHVNNIRYAQWVLDAVALDDPIQGDLASYEVNFTAETMLGDSGLVRRSLSPSAAHMFQGLRAGDQKPVFTSSFTVRQG